MRLRTIAIVLLILMLAVPVSAQEAEYELTYTSDIYVYAADIGPDNPEVCVGPDMPVTNPFDDPPEVAEGKFPRHNISFLTDMIVEITITEIGGNPSDKEMDVFVDFHHTGLQVAFLYVNDGDSISRNMGIEYSYQAVAAEALHITLMPADLTESATYEAKVTLYWSAQWEIRDIPEAEGGTDYTPFLLFLGAAALVTLLAVRRWRD